LKSYLAKIQFKANKINSIQFKANKIKSTKRRKIPSNSLKVKEWTLNFITDYSSTSWHQKCFYYQILGEDYFVNMIINLEMLLNLDLSHNAYEDRRRFRLEITIIRVWEIKHEIKR